MCPWHGYMFDIKTGENPDIPISVSPILSSETDASRGGIQWRERAGQSGVTLCEGLHFNFEYVMVFFFGGKV